MNSSKLLSRDDCRFLMEGIRGAYRPKCGHCLDLWHRTPCPDHWRNLETSSCAASDCCSSASCELSSFLDYWKWCCIQSRSLLWTWEDCRWQEGSCSLHGVACDAPALTFWLESQMLVVPQKCPGRKQTVTGMDPWGRLGPCCAGPVKRLAVD